MRVILLNGPPRSGKDTLARVLVDELPNAFEYKMSYPLKMFVRSIAGDIDDADKDKPQKSLNWLSSRQLQIDLAEQYIKPMLGEDTLGVVAARLMQFAETTGNDWMIVSDSGFAHEAVPIIEGVGSENVFLVRLYRTDTSFDEDSRDYIDLSSHGVKTLSLHNETTPDYLGQVVLESLHDHFNIGD